MWPELINLGMVKTLKIYLIKYNGLFAAKL